MSKRFIASPPGGQHHETVRQFQRIQAYLERLEQRIAPSGTVQVSDPLVLVTTWQDIPWTTTIPEGFEGVYQILIECFAVGANANAEAQFRLVDADDTPVVTGDIIPVGNASITIVQMFYAEANAGVRLQARGLNCTLSGMTGLFTRVGAAP